MLKLIPDKNQKDAIEFCLKNPYSIMALSVGVGKSLCALAIKDRIKDCRMLVIAPAYLLLNWKKEIEKSITGQIVSVFRKGSEFYYPLDSDIVIASYDLAIKNPDLFSWANYVVCDESHFLKTMTAKRTEQIHKLIYENSINRVHLLTGTPIKNRVSEFYSLIALCNYNPHIAGAPFLDKFDNMISFADHFSHRIEYERYVSRLNRSIKVLKWEGIQREEELKSWLKNIYIRRELKMPQSIYQDIFMADLKQPNLLAAFNSFMEEKTGISPTIKAEAALQKTPLTIEYVKGLIASEEQEGPILIFTDHRESCRALAEAFSTEGITGEMSVGKRQELADKFQAGNLPVLVATVGSFSTGYTLTRSNTLVWNDYPWVPGDMIQAEARINRKGQERQCYVHRILGSEQDEYILGVLSQKSETISKLY